MGGWRNIRGCAAGVGDGLGGLVAGEDEGGCGGEEEGEEGEEGGCMHDWFDFVGCDLM